MGDDSKFVLLSTRHATDSRKTSTNKSKFEITPGPNITFAKKVSWITPVQICVPNIFPNIKSGTKVLTSFTDDPDAPTEGPTAVPSGFYNEETLLTALAVVPNITYGTDGNGRLTITTSVVGGISHYMTLETAYQLGFPSNPSAPFSIVTDASGTRWAATRIADNTTVVTWPGIWNLGGEKMVCLSSTKLSHSGIFHGKDGLQYDVAFTVPLHDTSYGNTACYQPGDDKLASIYLPSEIQFDRIQFDLLDSEMNPLELPFNYHIDMFCKIKHEEHT